MWLSFLFLEIYDLLVNENGLNGAVVVSYVPYFGTISVSMAYLWVKNGCTQVGVVEKFLDI